MRSTELTASAALVNDRRQRYRALPSGFAASNFRRRGLAARSHVGSRATALAPGPRPIGVGRTTVAVRPVGISNSGPQVLDRGDHGPCDPKCRDNPRQE
jgi:hypothetical protein